MSRQQLKRWAAPLWASMSQALNRALSGPADGLGIQAHLPAHRPTQRSQSPQPGVQA
jgi:hypothetical protein